MEQSQLQASAHQHMMDDDDDFAEGGCGEETQAGIEEASLATAQALQQNKLALGVKSR